MATIVRFEDLEAWKIARELTREIYRVTSADKFSRDFGLGDQLRRASVSIMSNIAEGFERDGNKEFCIFLSIGKGVGGRGSGTALCRIRSGLHFEGRVRASLPEGN